MYVGLASAPLKGELPCLPKNLTGDDEKEPTIRALFNLAEQPLGSLSEQEKKKIFPADHLGIPLSIYVPDSYRKPNGKIDTSRHTVDAHHRFAPEKLLIHEYGELGKILRYSCLQVVPIELHKDFTRRYNKPLLPVTRIAKFGAILLSIARYLPAEAVAFEDGEVVRRELKLIERQRIWANNELRPERGPRIHKAMLEYVASQNITGEDDLIDEFITTTDGDIRIKRGQELFHIASEIAVEPIQQQYVDAWESGLLPRQDIRKRPQKSIRDIVLPRAVPKKPDAFIRRHLVKDKYVLASTINVLYDILQERRTLAVD